MKAISDELRGPDGRVREHWSYLHDALTTLGPEAIDSRVREAERLLRQEGVTYNVYSDPQGSRRPWALDPVPLLLTSDEWAAIERGLIQRAELLNLMLADLYGERDLLRRGLLPPALVFGLAGYLRPCHGTLGTQQTGLVHYAADIVRDAAGRPCVIGDRTQAPSGAGYALQNRRVMARLFPSLYRDSHVHRVARYFRATRQTLIDIAPADRDPAAIAVLTPGPDNEAYFEHAYLARYLGLDLVDSADLTVRDGRLYMRSLGSLAPVDVLLRRVDDDFCDPLELRQDSRLGVPGLLEAARRGNLRVANALGSGALESPALLPYLDAAARHLLGRPLELAQAPTWWCGEPQGLQHALARLPHLVIRPAQARSGGATLFGDTLGAAELDTWRQRLKTEGARWVVQDPVLPAGAPTWVDGALRPRPSVLRGFVVHSDAGYVALPGGLTRVSTDAHARVITNQSGSISKDTWVLASEPEREPVPRVSLPEAAAQTRRGPVPARAAENLFWLGRYAERAESLARAVSPVIDTLLNPEASGLPGQDELLHLLLPMLTHLTTSYPGFVELSPQERLDRAENELMQLVADRSRPTSLISALQGLVRASYYARGQLSTETWGMISDIESLAESMPAPGAETLSALLWRLEEIVKRLLALVGVTTESMLREPAWMFLDLGRRLERGVLTGAMLRAALIRPPQSPAVEQQLIETVLAWAESLMNYRRRQHRNPQIEALLELLLVDENNPRSLSYQFARMVTHLEQMPDGQRPPRRHAEERLVLEGSTLTRLAQPDVLAQLDAQGQRGALDQLLTRSGYLLQQVSAALAQRYFTPSLQSAQLVRTQFDALP